MKKFLSMLLTVAMLLGTTMLPAAAQEGSGLKLGLSIDTTIANSRDASAGADGLAQVDSDFAAVLVDAGGKIVDVYIDSAQAKMPFTAQGKLGADFPAEVQTKLEIGTAYGMGAVSKVGEWDAQIKAFEAYLIGKTAQEVQGIAVDSATHPTGADLTAGCTMAVGTYITAVVEAIEKAVPVAAAATDKVSLAAIITTSQSKDSMDGNDGLAEAYATYAAVTVNADGVITACLLDGTQGNVAFTAAGKITSDVTAATRTKQELGNAYGMGAVSPIGKEWFEQANAFAAYVTGKTAAQIDGIAMDAAAKPTGADLTASVTMSAGDLKACVLKALANAR